MKPATLVGALAAVAFASLAAPALGQADTDARFVATTLDISGHGEVKVPPDMATIELGVDTQAPTAAGASSENAVAMTKVVASLKARGVTDVKTATLSLSPQYAYTQGQSPRLTGYEADNRVIVTVDDLARLGAVVDAAVDAGANSVGQINFGLKTPGAPQNLARMLAVKALQDKATIYADAAGYHVRRLVNLTEASGEQGEPPVRPLMAMASAARAVTTPVEPGEITVSVDVAGEFELAR
jgi:hypothetical protein